MGGMTANIPRRLLRYEIKQGLAETLDTSIKESYPNISFGATASSAPLSIKMQPNGYKVIGNEGAANSSFWLWQDARNPTEYFKPVITFSGMVWSVAISDQFYAVGGDNPFLYIFNLADDSFISVSVTGLGRVTGLEFSADGAKLAVVHATAPYLRVYNTADWTFINAPVSAGAGRNGVGWTLGGSHIVTVGSTTPYVSVFKADMSAKVREETGVAYNNYNGASPKTHPTKSNKVIVIAGAASAANRKSCYEYDVVTGVSIDIIPITSRVTCTAIAIFPLLNRFYLSHSLDATAFGDTYLSEYNLETYERIGSPRNIEFMQSSSNTELLAIEKYVYKVSGTIRDINNLPVARVVTAHDRTTGEALARTKSDTATGNYTLHLADSREVDIQFHTEAGELLNDLFYARVIPEPVS